MKLNLTKERQQNIKNIILGSKITYGHYYYADNKREITWAAEVKDLYFDKEQARFVVDCEREKMSFREFLDNIWKETSYKTSNKKLKELAKFYHECNKRNDADTFNNYIDNLGNLVFKIDNVEFEGDEIDWLAKHVTSISAVFPPKYLKDFKRNFNTENYTVRNDGWHYAFKMHFDTLDGIPESLLQVRNSNGTNIDVEHKTMNNTSYIWNLVKRYPNLFTFGKRQNNS